MERSLDYKGRWRNHTVAFRVSDEEAKLLNDLVALSGLTKQEYIIRRLTCRDVVVQGNPRVYKALKNQMAAIHEELKRLEKDLSKSQEVCRTYDAIQSTYADILQNDNSIQEIRCNVLLDGLAEGAYTSDFVCVKADGDLMVRECIFRKFLTKPMTVKLLDASRDYWLKHGVSDWGIVIDEE